MKADQKANLLLAALGVVIAALIGAFASAKANPLSFPLDGQLPFWGGCASLTLSLASLTRAVLPDVGIGVMGRIHYFGDVAANDYTWSQALTLATATNLAERDIQQFAILARSVTRKYQRIRRGIFSAAFGLPLLFLGSLLGVTQN
ncbi:Pycsar system effector family protein [Streptomyces virginiae]|uniref:Pycsar system effector family protein n=1 Tax=Streptomyces virginiae TaxID=1961 RepID=UPI0035DABBF2